MKRSLLILSVLFLSLGTLTAGFSLIEDLENSLLASSTTDGPEQTATAMVPINDACSGAIALTLTDNTYTTTNYAGATGNDKPDVSSCSNIVGDPNSTSVGNGVWFSLTGTGDRIRISVDDTNADDTEINVLSGSCGSLTCIGWIDDPEAIIFPTTLGTEYFIYVGPWASSTV